MNAKFYEQNVNVLYDSIFSSLEEEIKIHVLKLFDKMNVEHKKELMETVLYHYTCNFDKFEIYTLKNVFPVSDQEMENVKPMENADEPMVEVVGDVDENVKQIMAYVHEKLKLDIEHKKLKLKMEQQNKIIKELKKMERIENATKLLPHMKDIQLNIQKLKDAQDQLKSNTSVSDENPSMERIIQHFESDVVGIEYSDDMKLLCTHFKSTVP